MAAMSVLNTKVLVLNRSYFPVHVTSLRRAFSLLYQGVAKAVDDQYQTFDFNSWSALSASLNDETIGLVGQAIKVPRVILLVAYDRVPKRRCVSRASTSLPAIKTPVSTAAGACRALS